MNWYDVLDLTVKELLVERMMGKCLVYLIYIYSSKLSFNLTGVK